MSLQERSSFGDSAIHEQDILETFGSMILHMFRRNFPNLTILSRVISHMASANQIQVVFSKVFVSICAESNFGSVLV